MRLCRFNDDRLGVLEGDRIADVTSVVTSAERIKPWPLPTEDWLIAHLDQLTPQIRRMVPGAPKLARAEVDLLSPIANPGKIIGAPVNYRAHLDEANADAAISFGTTVKTIDHYGLFLKANSSLIGPSQSIRPTLQSRRHDHEGELVVVIGRKCARVQEHEALDYVAGYCLGLDMTDRGVEERSMRKSLDTYTVLGPWLTTADEIANPDDLKITLTNNGVTKQTAETKDLIYDISRLIEFASSFYTLYPGDVYYTGTPQGVAPVKPGDVLRGSCDQIGAFEIAVRAHQA